MDYEKKYKEALERAKKLQKTCDSQAVIGWCEYIFPELKESEDELTWLKKYIEEEAYSLSMDIRDNEDRVKLKKLRKALAWLEKQGERKPTEKVESKFKVGDWILYSGDHYEGVRHITKINENGYYIERNGLPHGIIPFNHEICMRLWTIKDAKDGDVLAASDGSIFIFKEIVDCGCKHYIALEKDNETINVNDNLKHFWEAASGVKPATKKQRDLLYSKMKEAGYEWDAEKKELKLLITNGGDFFESENCEQKPADTVEPKCEESKTKVFDAPTSFEDKLYAFVLACEILVDPSKREFILEHSQEILDAAREQIGKEQKSSWSEEDERILNGLISSLVRIEANTRTDSTSINYTFPREINWLKALKQRCAWKPSDEQLEALKDAIRIKPFENPSNNLLWELYEQLKKLREDKL